MPRIRHHRVRVTGAQGDAPGSPSGLNRLTAYFERVDSLSVVSVLMLQRSPISLGRHGRFKTRIVRTDVLVRRDGSQPSKVKQIVLTGQIGTGIPWCGPHRLLCEVGCRLAPLPRYALRRRLTGISAVSRRPHGHKFVRPFCICLRRCQENFSRKAIGSSLHCHFTVQDHSKYP